MRLTKADICFCRRFSVLDLGHHFKASCCECHFQRIQPPLACCVVPAGSLRWEGDLAQMSKTETKKGFPFGGIFRGKLSIPLRVIRIGRCQAS